MHAFWKNFLLQVLVSSTDTNCSFSHGSESPERTIKWSSIQCIILHILIYPSPGATVRALSYIITIYLVLFKKIAEVCCCRREVVSKLKIT